MELTSKSEEVLNKLFQDNLVYSQSYLDHEYEELNLNCNELRYKWTQTNLIVNYKIIGEQKVHVDFHQDTVMKVN